MPAQRQLPDLRVVCRSEMRSVCGRPTVRRGTPRGAVPMGVSSTTLEVDVRGAAQSHRTARCSGPATTGRGPGKSGGPVPRHRAWVASHTHAATAAAPRSADQAGRRGARLWQYLPRRRRLALRIRHKRALDPHVDSRPAPASSQRHLPLPVTRAEQVSPRFEIRVCGTVRTSRQRAPCRR